MSEPENQDWQSTVYVIALDVENAAVLLQQNDDSTYALPHFAVEGGVWETTAAKMQEQIGPALQIEGQALYRAAYEAEEATCRGEAIIVLEAQMSQKMKGEWLARPALAKIVLANPAHCSLLERVLGELETGQIPEKRPSWARPGWQQAAVEWMTAELSRAGSRSGASASGFVHAQGRGLWPASIVERHGALLPDGPVRETRTDARGLGYLG
jgi:hypothetical protein